MAPEGLGAQVLPDLDLGSNLGVPSNFCLIKFPPKCTAEAPEPHRVPLLGPLDPGGQGIGCVQPHQIAIRDISCNFDFISYPS